jgi:hypothetical protein
VDDIGALCAYQAAQGRQFAQIADNAFASDTIADYIHATGLKSGDLLFDEWREVPVFIGCYDEDSHF